MLVTLSTALLVVIAVHFMRLLERTSWAWAGLVGAAVGILGALLLAADKGALCLTMSALDTVPANEFALMMPGLLAMFSHKGWMVLLWGIVLLPIGFAILAVALLKTRAVPRWQSALFLAGVLFVGFPDGAEIVNLTASVLMAAALVPTGCGCSLRDIPRAVRPQPGSHSGCWKRYPRPAPTHGPGHVSPARHAAASSHRQVRQSTSRSGNSVGTTRLCGERAAEPAKTPTALGCADHCRSID